MVQCDKIVCYYISYYRTVLSSILILKGLSISKRCLVDKHTITIIIV